MNIIFLSGPYKPSECGISDYIDLLSFELKKNHNVLDHISISKKNTLSNISRHIPPADLYSIQFAPYAFSENRFAKRGFLKLARSLKNKKIHVNFHEIWIGAYPKATLREKALGWIQKRAILKFLDITKPFLITCSNSAAMDRMQCAKIKTEYLYLFGNIPWTHYEKDDLASELSVVFFGTPYKKFPYETLAEKLQKISMMFKKSIHMKIIGRRREVEGLNEIIRISKYNGFTISQLGELSESKVSKELQSSDIGVSTTPFDILGKSGATAAMFEHGLPVLAYDDGDTSKNKLFIFEQFKNQLFLLNDDSMIVHLNKHMQKSRNPFFDGVAFTAKKMIDLIN